MFLIGLLLLAATAAFTGLAISDNLGGGPQYTVSVLGHDIATMSTLAIFCAGLALALLFSLGLWMTTGGALRRHSRKVRMREEHDAMAARLSAHESAAQRQPAATDESEPVAQEPTATEPVGRHHNRRTHLFGH